MKCESKMQLRDHIQMILEGGGEGMIMREPESLYQGGRSNSLFKFKAFE